MRGKSDGQSCDPERMRKIRVFSGGETTSYVSLDYQKQEGYIYRIAADGAEESSLWQKLLHAKAAPRQWWRQKGCARTGAHCRTNR